MSVLNVTMFSSILGASTDALAEDNPPPATIAAPLPPEEDDLPIPTLEIDRIPPSTSYEFAVQVSYGQIAYFRDSEPPWVGFGFRGGWGKNFGNHRLGVAGGLTAEGPIGVHTQLGFEPTVNWDFVSGKKFLLGFGAGPALIWTLSNETVVAEYGFVVSPTAMARIGWSETFSRVGRRLFLYLEPKVRLVHGDTFSPQVALVVGSGRGR